MFGFLLLLLNALHNADMEVLQLERRVAGPTTITPTTTITPAKPAQHRRIASVVQQLVEPLDEELVRHLESELPEIDYDFWYREAKPLKYRTDKECARYPDPLELQLHNTYWQTFINGNVTFRLYAAYWDDRNRAGVRVLATANQIGDTFPATQCQFWFEGYTHPILTNVSEYLSVWIRSWGSTPRLSYPHLITCPIPNELPPTYEQVVPRTVSLVVNACEDASNSLRIHNERRIVEPPSANASSAQRALSFGVCVKGFDFPYVDLSERLIEWFEMQRVLGAARIYAYMYDVHPAVQRVLDYYQRIGFLELRPLTMANGMPRLRHYQHMLLQQRRLITRLNELIPYNDCFYRNMYRHDYLLNVDIDELVMPMGALRTWQDIFDADRKLSSLPCPNGFASLCAINAYFTKVLPELHNHEQQEEADELFVLQHTMRYRNYSKHNRATKCFHNTRYALTLHNHFALKWISDVCAPRSVDIHLAQMQHYREPDLKYELSELVEDRNAWKYATELRAGVERAWLHMDDGREQSLTTAEDQNMLGESREREQESYQLQQQQQQA